MILASDRARAVPFFEALVFLRIWVAFLRPEVAGSFPSPDQRSGFNRSGEAFPRLTTPPFAGSDQDLETEVSLKADPLPDAIPA